MLNVFKKDTEVYAAPTIEVIAALNRTSPKNLYPISPAPLRNASAAGFSAAKDTPLTTTPNIAKNNRTLTRVAIPIPIIELLLISSRFSSFVILASISLCAPEKVIYPPTVPPRSVKIAGIKFEILSLGKKVSLTASPIGGFTIKITINITIIIHPPSTFVSVSIAFAAFFNKNIVIATPPEIKYPAILGIPSNVLNPNALPPTFPILNTSPPKATRNATKYPSPGKSLFAISCPRISLTQSTRHTLS